MKKPILILAIETSCDETAAAVLEMKATPPSLSLKRRGMGPQIKTLSSVVKSQISIHKSFGGVVPEAAARAHVKNILPVVQKALANSNIAVFDGRQKQQ
jgi:N6-L-threonylcarbamoyladenine synthase